MTALISNGASVPTTLWAMPALVAARETMSPAMRCEKNSMGRWSTFHMKLALDETAILPSTRSRYTAFKALTVTWTNAIAARTAMKGISQPGFSPVSKRSMKICESAGFTMPSNDVIAAVMATKASAAFAPCKRSNAKSLTEVGSPPGWKSSVGTSCRQTPVNPRSNSSMLILTSPLAGSFK